MCIIKKQTQGIWYHRKQDGNNPNVSTVLLWCHMHTNGITGNCNRKQSPDWGDPFPKEPHNAQLITYYADVGTRGSIMTETRLWMRVDSINTHVGLIRVANP